MSFDDLVNSKPGGYEKRSNIEWAEKIVKSCEEMEKKEPGFWIEIDGQTGDVTYRRTKTVVNNLTVKKTSYTTAQSSGTYDLDDNGKPRGKKPRMTPKKKVVL